MENFKEGNFENKAETPQDKVKRKHAELFRKFRLPIHQEITTWLKELQLAHPDDFNDCELYQIISGSSLQPKKHFLDYSDEFSIEQYIDKLYEERMPKDEQK